MNQIFQSSDKLKQMRQIDRRWETIEIGQSFIIPLNEIKLATLRAKAVNKGNRLNKRFRVIRHENCYEVGRIEKETK